MMDLQLKTYFVPVWDKQVSVSVRQDSKTVFTASGYHQGKSFSKTGRSAKAAVERWRKAAESQKDVGIHHDP
jgi:hypothetical protein